MLSLLRLECKQKNYANPFRICIFLFLSYSLGIETINSGSLENHTQFQTKMGQVYTCFQTKMAQKPYPMGAAHTYMAYIREYPPPPPTRHPRASNTVQSTLEFIFVTINPQFTFNYLKNVEEFQVSFTESGDGTMEMKSFCFTVFNIALLVY